MSEPLDDLDDKELGKLVRNTAAFRAAAACARFAGEAQELRENDTLAFDRLIAETHQKQGPSVSVRDTTASIVDDQYCPPRTVTNFAPRGRPTV